SGPPVPRQFQAAPEACSRDDSAPVSAGGPSPDSQGLPGKLVAAPLDPEIVIFGRAEAAAEAVVEGVQIAAEVAAGTVDRFSNEMPEVLQALDLAAIDDIDHRHSPHDRSFKDSRSSGLSAHHEPHVDHVYLFR